MDSSIPSHPSFSSRGSAGLSLFVWARRILRELPANFSAHSSAKFFHSLVSSGHLAPKKLPQNSRPKYLNCRHSSSIFSQIFEPHIFSCRFSAYGGDQYFCPSWNSPDFLWFSLISSGISDWSVANFSAYYRPCKGHSQEWPGHNQDLSPKKRETPPPPPAHLFTRILAIWFLRCQIASDCDRVILVC